MATHPSILPGEFCGARSPEGYSPGGHKASDMTEQLSNNKQQQKLQDRPCILQPTSPDSPIPGASSILPIHPRSAGKACHPD